MSTASASPAPTEGCRPARVEDLPRLLDLVERGVAELSANKGGGVWALAEARQRPYRDRLEAELDDPDALVLAGTIDDVVIGYAVAAIRPLPGGGQLGVLTDVFVEPGAREVGVGDRLLDHVLDWCRDRGCIGVDSIALPGDRHTKNFFEAHGLVARAIVVHRSLR